jgi:protein MpaA
VRRAGALSLALPLLALLAFSPLASPAGAAGFPVVTERIGESVQGRPIGLVRAGDPDGRRTALVVGCVHGDECAGRAIAERLARVDAAQAPGLRLLVVRNMNPDGFARGTRQNARGVDLNRNALVGWRPMGEPGSRFHSGRRAFSEPESRAIRALILRERPSLVVWYHQPLRGVDVPEVGDDLIARRYARRVGLPVRPLPAYPGSLSRWVNTRVVEGSSFVVELAAGPLSVDAARRHARAVLALGSG